MNEEQTERLLRTLKESPQTDQMARYRVTFELEVWAPNFHEAARIIRSMMIDPSAEMVSLDRRGRP